ncbi:MAG TPA: DUF3293 domain-containing protein [Acidimicrobiales bacterium]
MELLAPDDPWAAYARTVVVIVRPDSPNLVVAAAPVGEAGGWPWPAGDAVHVLTAWDPGDARPGDVENRRRQADLEGEIQALAPGGMWTAVGVDAVSEHREEGVAVCGLDLDVVVALGARYDQDAIFEWTASEWAIVACRGGRREAFGWSVTGGLRVLE